jgi:hypothetical protein
MHGSQIGSSEVYRIDRVVPVRIRRADHATMPTAFERDVD